MADPHVFKAENVFSATIGSTDVTAGDMMYFDGTDWELADASAHTTFCEAMAVNTYDSGDVGVLCTGGMLVDTDAPYTQGAAMYLSETAGAITATIPTTNAAIKQVVGFSLSTSEVRVAIRNPSYQNQFFPVSAYDTSGEPGLGVATDGWPGPGLDGASETAYVVGRFPDNFVELEMARVVTNNSAGSAVDYDFSVTSGYDNASNAQDTGTAVTASTSETTPADNLLVTFDVSGVLDSGLQGPGRNFSILIDPDGVGGGEQQILGLNLGTLVV